MIQSVQWLENVISSIRLFFVCLKNANNRINCRQPYHYRLSKRPLAAVAHNKMECILREERKKKKNVKNINRITKKPVRCATASYCAIWMKKELNKNRKLNISIIPAMQRVVSTSTHTHNTHAHVQSVNFLILHMQRSLLMTNTKQQ